MSKSNAKTLKPCGYQRQHPAHTYPVGAPEGRKAYCKGMPGVEPHRHVWERQYAVRVGYDVANRISEGDLVNGPFECSCGMSRWLTDGRAVYRSPQAEPLDRIMALKAKLDSGKKLNEADQQELEAIAQALIETFKPLRDAMVAMAEQIGSYIQAFLDQIPPETIAQLVFGTIGHEDAIRLLGGHRYGEMDTDFPGIHR